MAPSPLQGLPSYYAGLRLRGQHPPPHRSNRLVRRIMPEVRSGSLAPLSPLYLWLTFPTCLPRRPRRRLRTLTIIQCAGVGLHPCTRDSASPGLCHVEAHWLWFIFIQAHRFFVRTAYSPRHLAARQAPDRSVVNRPIRRVGLSPTSATTFTGCCGASWHCPRMQPGLGAPASLPAFFAHSHRPAGMPALPVGAVRGCALDRAGSFVLRS